MASFLFRGGRLIDPASGTDSTLDVLVEDGVVAEVGTAISSLGATVLDIEGAVICPGFVDMHVHLREPGREDEETIESGSSAAALGGFTAVCAMPNTDPVCDTAAVAEKVRSEGVRVGLTEVVPAGALTKGLQGKQMAAIGEMIASSAAVRLFTDDGSGVQSARLLRRTMEYIRTFDAICAEHCEDSELSEGGQMHEGFFSDLLGLKGTPAQAEEIPLARDLSLARLTGVRYHAQHISTAGSLELIRSARAQGVRVSAEVTPHHLTLTDAELASFDPIYKVNPPLRSSADVEALRQGLADGTIDVIATDHAPHAQQEKEAEFELAPPGMLGLETALAVLLEHVVDSGVISLPQLVSAMSLRPARILRLEGQGGPVEPGAVANLTVFDPEAEWVVDSARFASRSRNSPWDGRRVKGRVVYTSYLGRIVVAEGKLAPELVGATP